MFMLFFVTSPASCIVSPPRVGSQKVKVTAEKYQAVQEETKSQCYCMSLSVLSKTIIILLIH